MSGNSSVLVQGAAVAEVTEFEFWLGTNLTTQEQVEPLFEVLVDLLDVLLDREDEVIVHVLSGNGEWIRQWKDAVVGDQACFCHLGIVASLPTVAPEKRLEGQDILEDGPLLAGIEDDGID